ncbi:hypothetical protein THAOC_23438, partial [Thalassiosira oceanica]
DRVEPLRVVRVNVAAMQDEVADDAPAGVGVDDEDGVDGRVGHGHEALVDRVDRSRARARRAFRRGGQGGQYREEKSPDHCCRASAVKNTDAL